MIKERMLNKGIGTGKNKEF